MHRSLCHVVSRFSLFKACCYNRFHLKLIRSTGIYAFLSGVQSLEIYLGDPFFVAVPMQWYLCHLCIVGPRPCFPMTDMARGGYTQNLTMSRYEEYVEKTLDVTPFTTFVSV